MPVRDSSHAEANQLGKRLEHEEIMFLTMLDLSPQHRLRLMNIGLDILRPNLPLDLDSHGSLWNNCHLTVAEMDNVAQQAFAAGFQKEYEADLDLDRCRFQMHAIVDESLRDHPSETPAAFCQDVGGTFDQESGRCAFFNPEGDCDAWPVREEDSGPRSMSPRERAVLTKIWDNLTAMEHSLYRGPNLKPSDSGRRFHQLSDKAQLDFAARFQSMYKGPEFGDMDRKTCSADAKELVRNVVGYGWRPMCLTRVAGVPSDGKPFCEYFRK